MKNSRFSYVFTQGFLALCSWIMLSLIGKKLGAEALGEYSFALSIVSPIILFAGFQMRQSYLTSKKFAYESYLGTRSVILIGLVLFCLILNQLLSVDLILALLVLKSSDSLWEIIYSDYQKNKELTKGSVLSLTRYLFMIVTFFICLNLMTFDLTKSVLLTALVSFIFVFPILLKSSLRFSAQILKDLWRLGGASIITAVLFNLPRYSIKYYYGNYELGVLTAIISFYGLWQVFFNSYFNSILDRLSSQSTWHALKLPLLSLALCGIIFIFIDDKLYELMFGAKLAIASEFSFSLILLIMTSLFLSFENYRLIASGDYHSQFKINFVTVVLGVPLVFAVTSAYGIRGSLLAYACLLSFQAVKLRYAYAR